MGILDSEGRLFGRVNLIDAVVGLFMLALVPLAYGSWVFFRTPVPIIDGVTPNVVSALRKEQYIDLHGRHLRPYLRAGVGGEPARYLFLSAERAQIEVPSLAAGSHDVTLFDDSREVARLPKAVTVKAEPTPVGPPPPELTAITPRMLDNSRNQQRIELRGRHFRPSLQAAVGSKPAVYEFQSAERAAVLVPPLGPGTYDLALSDDAKELIRYPNAITALGPVVESITPHVLSFSRETQRLELKGKRLQHALHVFIGWREVRVQVDSEEHAVVDVPALPAGTYDLAISDNDRELARYRRAVTIEPTTFADLRMSMRFVTRPEVLTILKKTQPASPVAAPTSSEPVLISYEVVDEVVGTTTDDRRQGRAVVVNAVVRVLAAQRPDGWMFDGQAVRAGAPFTLNTQTFSLTGDILSVEVIDVRKQ